MSRYTQLVGKNREGGEKRRYERSRVNFFELYSSLADYWIVDDNSQSSILIVAEKTIHSNSPVFYLPSLWQHFAQEFL